MTQILANAGAVTLTKYWYVNGTHSDVGDVTIGIVDGHGSTVVASGTATTNNTTSYTYSLADQANPKILIVTWTDVDTTDTRVDRIEVIGNWLFTETQARTFGAKADGAAASIPLATAAEYSDAMLADERERLTADLEYWTGRSWVPRYARVELPGSGTSTIDLGHPSAHCRTSDGYALHRPGRLSDIATILTATDTGTSITTSNIKINGRQLILTNASWTVPTYSSPHNIVIELVYGLPYLADGVDRIALMELIDRLVPSMWPERAIQADTEYGSTRLIQPGGPMNNVSRLPRVNDWVARHDHRIWI